MKIPETYSKLHIETDFPRTSMDLCPVCNADNFKFIYRLYDDRYGMPDDFNVMRCNTCGSHFLDQYISDRFIVDVYSKFYEKKQIKTLNKYNINTNSLRLKLRNSSIWAFVMGGVDLAGYIKPGEKVLDVGCGYGTNIGAVLHRGGTWCGIDVDKKVSDLISDIGMPFFHGRLQDFVANNNEKFDVIMLSQLIEHTPHPISLLNAAKQCLNDDGRVLLSCPNVESRYLKKYGSSWIHWHVPYHIVQFSIDSLQIIAKRSGLMVEWSHTATPPSWYLAQRAHSKTPRGVKNSSYSMPFEPLKWLALAPFLRLKDNMSPKGDALIASLVMK